MKTVSLLVLCLQLDHKPSITLVAYEVKRETEAVMYLRDLRDDIDSISRKLKKNAVGKYSITHSSFHLSVRVWLYGFESKSALIECVRLARESISKSMETQRILENQLNSLP